jgi:hypothetical protein
LFNANGTLRSIAKQKPGLRHTGCNTNNVIAPDGGAQQRLVTSDEEGEVVMDMITTPDLGANPDVRIFFSGLMVLQPAANGQSCEVFVHRSAPNHQLTIEVRQKQAGKPDLIKMRHVGPLPYALQTLDAVEGDPPIHGMTIKVDTNPKGIKAFKPLKGQSPEGASLEYAINIQGGDFHGGNIGEVDMLGGRPSILLNDAIFYTADTTSPELTINLKKNNQKVKTLEPFASLIGGNIYLDQGDSVSVMWQVQGVIEELKLAKRDDGVSYEIYIVNDPLYENETLQIPEHDELREYYKLFPQVTLQEQFRLEVIPPALNAAAGPERGSTRNPCMSVLKI